jgi:glycosyltransferase involved in cell wall biosynthesis
VFLPSLGGIEVVSATLASQLVALGHEVSVMTTTINSQPDDLPYQVYRNPSLIEKLKLIATHQLIHSNGASMALFYYAKLLGKPFMWTHGGYQLSCIDGLGWVDGEPAPLRPIESIKFHYKKQGLKFAAIQSIKLLLRRIAGNWVHANVAITQWVANRQPLPRQTVIYNPFPLHHFMQIPRDSEKKYDFIYVGRLVSEKGVPDLILAFEKLLSLNPSKTLKLAIVGDGNWREKIEALVLKLGLKNNVVFWGKKSGQELYKIIAESNIGVVPSVWEEPMGGVAMELLAAGKPLIVSKHGGLSECAGNAALAYDNGNVEQLSHQMHRLLNSPELQNQLIENASERIKMFDARSLSIQYEVLYKKIVGL